MTSELTGGGAREDYFGANGGTGVEYGGYDDNDMGPAAQEVIINLNIHSDSILNFIFFWYMGGPVDHLYELSRANDIFFQLYTCFENSASIYF